MRKVVIFQPVNKRYRTPFFERLARALEPDGVRLEVLYSEPWGDEAAKSDNERLPEPLGRRIPRIPLLGGRALLQMPPVRSISSADLIVLVQANGYLHNYPLLALSWLGMKRVAYWGHGRNLQGDPSRRREFIKRCLAPRVDWWFAYTDAAANYLKSIGVASDRITSVQNAVDTRALRRMASEATDAEVAAMRARLNVSPANRICVYCGSLYRGKRLDFLLQAGRLIHSRVPEFRLVVVGSGPDRSMITDALGTNEFLRYAGPMFGRDKAVVLRMSDLFLNPGAVGLAILDAFATGLPLVTTAEARHGPEIGYLENGMNGLVLAGEVVHYADAVAALLGDTERLKRLRVGAMQSGESLTLENMVSRFRSGILECLDSRNK